MSILQKIKIQLFVLSLAIAVGLASCSKDNEEDLYGNNEDDNGDNGALCDTENVSFANQVWPVIESSCISCHSGAAPIGGYRMGNYTELVETINTGRFLGAIKHESGYSPMPQGGPKLDDCTIEKIEAWIDDGMPDN